MGKIVATTFDANLNGTGTREMAADWSNKLFGRRWTGPLLVHQIRTVIRDGSVEWDEFMGLAAALTNGIYLRIDQEALQGGSIQSGGSLASGSLQFHDTQPLKTTADLGRLGDIQYYAGTPDDVVIWTIDFVKLFGAPLGLPLGARLGFLLNDDLSTLTSMVTHVYATES